MSDIIIAGVPLASIEMVDSPISVCPDHIAKAMAKLIRQQAEQLHQAEQDARRFVAIAEWMVNAAAGNDLHHDCVTVANYLEQHHPDNVPPITLDAVRAAMDAVSVKDAGQ